MADLFLFPTNATVAAGEASTDDRFLLDEGLELLSDFRSIDDRQVRDSVRRIVKSLALAGRKAVASRDDGAPG